MQLKNNDVFRWSYTVEQLKRKRDGDNGGTTYWAVSRIAIVDHIYLVDTYSICSENRMFTVDDIGKTIDVEFLGNLDDYEKAEPSDRAMYSDKDIMDLNHSNSSRGNFYIKKGATKDFEKIKRVLHRNIRKLKFQIETLENSMERSINLLDHPEDFSYYCIEKSVSLCDEDYYDTIGRE